MPRFSAAHCQSGLRTVLAVRHQRKGSFANCNRAYPRPQASGGLFTADLAESEGTSTGVAGLCPAGASPAP